MASYHPTPLPPWAKLDSSVRVPSAEVRVSRSDRPDRGIVRSAMPTRRKGTRRPATVPLPASAPSALSSHQTEVLIVGAGPSGLVLALWLRRLGVRVRIVDKATLPGTTSRALAVHARTLELYRQIGLSDEVVERGLEFAAINLWVRGRQTGHVPLGDIGRGLTPFPYVVIFPQDQHERLLIERLSAAGVEVERGIELVGFEEAAGRVFARTRAADGTEDWLEAEYIAGCDGAHSKVREVLGLGFPGGTYQRVFYVADVALHGAVANHELHVALDEADFLAVFPLKGENVARLIGTVRLQSEEERQALTWNDVSQQAMERMQITVDRVNWFSTYRVHHRVADQFGRGRAFLVGDAAHIHSPVGGQGMNTGIGDAVNLAWKLAAVVRRRAHPRLLESYQPERQAFARRLVATTDRAFTFVTRDGPLARRVRLDLVPRILPRLAGRTAVRRFMFRVLSQTQLHYRLSRLSQGQAGSVRGGDRLPWVPAVNAGGEDNFTPLDSLDWQLHVYGEAPADLIQAAAGRSLPLHQFAWQASMEATGLSRDAAYLVRPDGYVALCDPGARARTLERYLDAQGLRFGRGPGRPVASELAKRVERQLT
jgi:2-polyprenyl-6-methoxyphenol hydroxylase-like FAD-dependent oxidoreductase